MACIRVADFEICKWKSNKIKAIVTFYLRASTKRKWTGLGLLCQVDTKEAVSVPKTTGSYLELYNR